MNKWLHLLYIIIFGGIVYLNFKTTIPENPESPNGDLKILALTHFFDDLKREEITIYKLDSIKIGGNRSSIPDSMAIAHEVEGYKIRVRPVQQYDEERKGYPEGLRYTLGYDYVKYNHEIVFQFALRALYDKRLEVAGVILDRLLTAHPDIPDIYKYMDEIIVMQIQPSSYISAKSLKRVKEFTKNAFLYAGLKDTLNFNIDMLIGQSQSVTQIGLSQYDRHRTSRYNKLNTSNVVYLSSFIYVEDSCGYANMSESEKEQTKIREIREHLRAIYLISDRQDSWSNDMPEISKIAELGAKNIPYMLNFLNASSSWRFEKAMIFALTRIATDKEKPLILDALKHNRKLIEVIINKRWEKDAQDILITAIQTREEWYPTDWIDAVALLKDTATYVYLKEYLRNGSNKLFTYNAIKDLAGIKLDTIVAELWENRPSPSLSYDVHEEMHITRIAIDYGYREALEHYIKDLSFRLEEKYYMADDIRDIFKISTDYPSDAGWYTIFKDRISFNTEKRKWVVQ